MATCNLTIGEDGSLSINFEVSAGELASAGLTPGESATVTSDAQGHAAFKWQLGASGPQRVRIDLLDPVGQVIQRLSFDATVIVKTRGCEVTIGKGGDFEALDVDLLRKLLAQGDGNACVCFLPGTHEVPNIEIDGKSQFKLSLHGCGHTALLNLRGPLTFFGFAALELRDLAMRAEGETSAVFQKTIEVRVANILFDRSKNAASAAALSVCRSCPSGI